jgi:flagellar basal-body rod protein FlgF
MSDPITAAYSALQSRLNMVDVIANNLANAQTSGFKKDFAHILESEQGFDTATTVDLSPGDMVPTGHGLDAAIDGSGFFAVQTSSGIRYTRAGSFIVNADGDLVTKDGMKLLSNSNSPINVGDGQVAIQDGGVVTVDGNETAQLKIVNFRNAHNLEKEGLYRFKWNGAANDVVDVPEPRVKGGYLEASNVNAVDEMVHLMSAYRDFESVQRTMKTMMTDMNSRLIQELGKLS